MKKTLFTFLVCVMFGTFTSAQTTDEERAARMQERQQKQTEALIKNLKLTDEQETKFREIYTNYQTELATTMQMTAPSEEGKSKKELTDAEATAQLNAYFEKQATQITNQQKRLEVQFKYLSEFSAILTPQQVLKVYHPTRQSQDRNRRGNSNGFHDDNRGGNFGGGDFVGGGFPSSGGFGGSGF